MMRPALLLICLGACVDAPLPTPDTRHVELPRGATAQVGVANAERAVTSDEAIAATAIMASGDVRVTAMREGDAVIEIDHDGVVTTVATHVAPPAIIALTLAPHALAAALGATLSVRAYATDTTGAVADVTPHTLWQIDDPTIAALAPGGGIRGMTVGDTTLRAVIADAAIAVPITVR